GPRGNRAVPALPRHPEHRGGHAVRARDRPRGQEGGRCPESDRPAAMTSRRTLTFVRPRMGTLLAITLATRDVASSVRDAEAAFDQARRYERVMGRPDPLRELARLKCDARLAS